MISLYRVVRWLKEQAEALGIEVFPGFAAAGILYDGDRVVGVETRDAGMGQERREEGASSSRAWT